VNSGTAITQRNGWNDGLSSLRYSSSSSWSSSWATTAASNSNGFDGNSSATIGNSYTTAPTVTITGGGGTGATPPPRFPAGKSPALRSSPKAPVTRPRRPLTLTGGGGVSPSGAQTPVAVTIASQHLTAIASNAAVPYRRPYDKTAGLPRGPP